MTLSKRDITYAIITGLTAGALGAFILLFLKKSLPFDISPIWMIAVVPLLWIAGVQLGYFLGKWIKPFEQFGIFAAIGFTNFAVDTGVLNLLIAESGIFKGIWYSVFKGVSFCVAVVHSYYWNRRWTFKSRGPVENEAPKFFLVMILSLLVNVAVASLAVYLLPTSEINANIGAVVGSAVALIFSFIGFRLIVFRQS